MSSVPYLATTTWRGAPRGGAPCGDCGAAGWGGGGRGGRGCGVGGAW